MSAGTTDGSSGVSRIVVGVDGSETSRHALRWAAAEAIRHDAELNVVYAWEVPALGAGVGIAPGRRATAPPEGQRDAAEHLITEVIAEELGANPPAKVRPSIGRGTAAGILLEASQGADLLVVGSRGTGGFAGLLLGSVSTKMANHATCPVVIVRPPALQDRG
jgi:nucleotide-binding universal stress UspA family protein